MTKEKKVTNRKAKSKYRKAKRMEKYIEKIKNAKGPSWLSLSEATGGAWPDSSSPTGYSQVCDYQPGYEGSICQSPCNGDC
jgi:hypothetical protein